MSLKFLNKPLILRIVLIIVVFLCAIIIGKIIFEQYQEKYWEKEQKEVERLSKLSLDELTKKIEEKPCLNMVNALESENNTCEIFRESDLRDNCYFCFAITKKDELFCNKITEGSSLKKSCEKEFLVIEEMEWKTYSESGYSIEYPPYFKVTQENPRSYGSFTTFGLDTDLARKAGFNLGEYISISVQITDLTRESITSEKFRNFFQKGSKKEFDRQEYPDIEEINGQIFYKRESWYYYTSLKEVTWKYITRNQKGTRAAIITFESNGISEDDIPSKLNFKERVLSSFKF